MRAESRGRRLVFRGLLLAFYGGLLAAFFGGFLAVTDAYIARQGPKTLVYNPSALRRIALAPNQSYRHGDVAFSINRYGFRGQAPGPKKGRTLRIVALGGSSVFDHWLGEGQSWPERLAPLLEERGFESIESFNAGVPGYSSRETFSFYTDRIRLFEPDVVVFYQGWNDAKYMKAFENGVDVDSFYRARELSRYRFLTARRPLRNWYALREMVGAPLHDERPLGENAAPPSPRSTAHPAKGGVPANRWQVSPGMGFWRRNVESLTREVLRDGALPVLVAQNTLVSADLPESERTRIRYDFVDLDHEELLEVNERMIEAARQVAGELGAPYVDLRSRLNGESGYFADHVHMKPLGSQTFAWWLADELAKILESRGRARNGERGRDRLLVARWNLDRIEAAGRRVRDEGGFEIHGEASAGVEARQDGRFAGCLAFDGLSGDVTVASTGMLHLSRRFRIELWLRLDGAPVAAARGLVVKAGAYHLALRQGRLAFYGYGLEPERWHVSERSVPRQGWQQVAVEFSGGEVTLWLNGEEVYRAAVAGEVRKSSKALSLGGGNGPFQGCLDRVELSLEMQPEEHP